MSNKQYVVPSATSPGSAGGGGTVTSVGLTAPAILNVSGSPVTTSGTLALTLATESANTVFSGPTSGGATTPTFRTLVSADLPAGTGTVTSVSGTANQIDVATGTTTPVISLDTVLIAPGTVSVPGGNLSSGANSGAAGVLNLQGSTSGTASITAPAVAGTNTNGVTFSNVILAPNGAGGTTAYGFTGAANWGMFRDATNGLIFAVGGTSTAGFQGSGKGLMVSNTGLLSFTSSGITAANIDVAVSRDSAGVLDIGSNGTAGNKGGSVNLTNLTATGIVTTKRVNVDSATTLVSGDFSLSAGWGNTAALAITVTTSKDQACCVTITTGGTGIAANPTLTLTFHDGTWTNVPVCIAHQTGGNDFISDITVTARSATAYTFQFNGTPTTAKTYEISILTMGT